MPRLVLDTSSLVRAALAPRAAAGRLLAAARAGAAEVVGSSETMGEVARVLARPKFAGRLSGEGRQRFMADLGEVLLMMTPLERVRDCRDPDDDMILEVALAAGSDGTEVIVATDDLDLLVLDPWRGVRVVKPEAALALLDGIGNR